MQLKRSMATLVVLLAAVSGFAQAGFKPTWAQSGPPLGDAIQGAWIVSEIGGEKIPTDDQPIMVKFIGTEYFITRGEETVEAGQFQLTPQDGKMLVDFLIRTGPAAGQRQLGIIQHSGDDLSWCMCEAGSKYRPNAFYNHATTGDQAGQTVVKTRWARVAAPAPAITPGTSGLQGRWQVTSVDGKLPGGEYVRDIVTFFGDHFRWDFQNGGFGGPVHLDLTTSPMQIDLQSETDASEVYRGIFEVHGTELRLHVVEGKDAKRPKDFSDPECNAYLLVRADAAGRLIKKPEPGSPRTAAATATVPPPQAARSSASPRPAASALDMQGNWIVSSLGDRTPPRRMAFVFTGDRFKLDDGGMVMFAGHWTVDAGRTPAEINLQTEDGQGQTSGVWRGLIEQQGDSLRLCLPDPDKPASPRPTTFATSANGETVVILASRGAAPADARSLKLQGTWDVVLEGSDAPSAPTSFSFDGDRFRMERGGTVMFIGHWQADAARRPITIDLQLEDARGNSDQSWLGLVELTGDSVMLCLPRPGEPRPAEFKDSPPNTDGPGILTLQKR